MTKAKAKELQEKYKMEILRHDITKQAEGLQVMSKELIPELDALAESNEHGWNYTCIRERFVDRYRYRLFLPTDWIDLWGWK